MILLFVFVGINPTTSYAQSEVQPNPISPAPAPGVGPGGASDLDRDTGTQARGPAPAPPANAPKRASPTSTTGNGTWYDPNDPDAEPIQGKTYDRANDTLGLMIEYSFAKLERLREEVSSNPKGVIDSLGGAAFCPEDKAGDCLDRYERFILLEANRMNNAVALNDTSNAALRSNGFDPATGKPRGERIPVFARMALPNGKPAPSARPELPYLPSFDDLNSLHKKEAGNMQASFNKEYEQWLKNDYGKAPNCNDFPKFRKILRNPDKPSEGNFLVVARDPKDPSKALCDEQNPAYKLAKKAYELAKDNNRGIEMDRDTLLNAFEKASKDKSKKPKITSDLEDKESAQALNNDIFKKTRDESISNLNKQLGKHQKTGTKATSRGTASSKAKPQTSGNLKLDPGNFTDHFILLNGDETLQKASSEVMMRSSAVGNDPSAIANPGPVADESPVTPDN